MQAPSISRSKSLGSGQQTIVHVAVPSRNWTLFHCVFRAHYRVRSAVTQNFRYRHGGHMRWVNVSSTYEFTQRVWAPPATEVQHYKCGNAIAMCNGIMFDFYPGLPHMYLMCTCFWTQMMTGKLIKACPEDAHLHTFVRATLIVSGDRNYLLKHSQCEQHKPSRWPATKAIVHVFNIYVFLNSNNDRAELKAHKSMPRTIMLIYARTWG